MKTINDVIKRIVKQTGYTEDVVRSVCMHPFIFTTNVMKDGEDIHEILFNTLFKFKLKRRFIESKNNKKHEEDKTN